MAEKVFGEQKALDKTGVLSASISMSLRARVQVLPAECQGVGVGQVQPLPRSLFLGPTGKP